VAGGSGSVVFLLLETLSRASAGDVVSLEVFEELKDLIVREQGCSGVENLRKEEMRGKEENRDGGGPP
jgi:hypothetical protein